MVGLDPGVRHGDPVMIAQGLVQKRFAHGSAHIVEGRIRAAILEFARIVLQIVQHRAKARACTYFQRPSNAMKRRHLSTASPSAPRTSCIEKSYSERHVNARPSASRRAETRRATGLPQYGAAEPPEEFHEGRRQVDGFDQRVASRARRVGR